MGEKWVDIPHFENLYQISSLGRVRSKDRVRIQQNAHGDFVERFYPSKMIDIDYNGSSTGTVNMYDCNRKVKFSVYVMYSVVFGWLEAEALYHPNIFTHYDDEEWVDIEGTDGAYQVSNYSQVRKRIGNIKTYGGYSYQMLRPFENCGYWNYDIIYKGKSKKFKGHRLAAQAFIPNVDDKPYINHKDGVKKDNHISNLEWCTPKENTDHAWRTGLITNEKYCNSHRQFKIHTSIPVYCPELNKLFGSMREAKDFFDTTYYHIRGMLNEHKLYCNCTLEYADEVN